MDTRLQQQITFLIEIDKMKGIFRRTLVMDHSRRENDAEHSWHFATMALVLAEYAKEEIDLPRVLKMALVHDLVEIYAGDTSAYADSAAQAAKEAQEQASADRLFALLPTEQGAEYRALWEEFDAMETPDARYAAAIDRLQPFISNYMTDGHTWRQNRVTRAQVLRRMDMVRLAAPALWSFVEQAITEGIEKGWILP